MKKNLKILIYHYKAELIKEKLLKKYPHLVIKTWTKKEDIDNFAEEAEIIICWKFPDECLKRAKKLFWIQLVSAGSDQITNLPSFSRNIMISTAGGVHTTPIAEYVICYILSLYQGTFDLMNFQKENKWGRIKRREVKGKTLGIVGLGKIGKEIARKAKAFDMKVAGIKRKPESVEFVDEVLGPHDLHGLLGKSDFVVISTPLTALTRNLISKKELEIMKHSAYLINIARGEIVEEKALIEALKNDKIKGAVIDVFEEEPLPEKSELWDTKNLIITPHISWLGEYTLERVIASVTDNIGRYIEGKEIKNIVDPKEGY